MQQLHLSGSHLILIETHLRCWRSSQRSTTLETLAAWRRPASRSSLRRSKGEMLALQWPMRLPARLPDYKRSSYSFFLFRLKSWECSLPSQPTSQSRHTESILGTVQVTQNVKKWQRFISPFFVYKTTENFRSGGLCNVHGKDRRSCHREHFHRNGEAYQLSSRTKIYYFKIKQYLQCRFYIALLSQFRFIGTMARWPTRMTLKPIHFGSPTPTLMWVQTCYIKTYLATFQPGKYNINVTAYNLHSNELYGYNKFINNMTRWGQCNGRFFSIFFFCVSRTLLIQKPVENWKLEVIFSLLQRSFQQNAKHFKSF